MEAWLEEMHNEFVQSDNYYPRLKDIEYDWWVQNAQRPAIINDEFNWFNKQSI